MKLTIEEQIARNREILKPFLDLMPEKTWNYYGCNITRAQNEMIGNGYSAYVPGFGFVQADTLQGVKKLIKAYK